MMARSGADDRRARGHLVNAWTIATTIWRNITAKTGPGWPRKAMSAGNSIRVETIVTGRTDRCDSKRVGMASCSTADP